MNSIFLKDVSMIRPIITLRRKRVLVDVDIQRDAFLSGSPNCIKNHRRVLANIRRLMAWARITGVRQISTVRDFYEDEDHHTHNEPDSMCLQKISYTLRDKNITYRADGCTDLPRDVLRQYDQVVLHKRCENPFKEPRADRILSELRADEFLIMGGLAEEAVKATVLGLLARKKYVTVLTDAVGSREKNAAEIALRQMMAKGARLIEVKALLGISCLRQVGVCGCDRCLGKLAKPLANTG
jgi:nicotinamidase-related amidase